MYEARPTPAAQRRKRIAMLATGIPAAIALLVLFVLAWIEGIFVGAISTLIVFGICFAVAAARTFE